MLLNGTKDVDEALSLLMAPLWEQIVKVLGLEKIQYLEVGEGQVGVEDVIADRVLLNDIVKLGIQCEIVLMNHQCEV